MEFETEEQKLGLLKVAIEQHMPANSILGFEITEVKRGYAKIHVPFKDEFVGDFIQGLWHGGIIASIADTAGGIAAATELNDARDKVNTIDMRIDYLHGAIKEDVECEATLIKAGKRILNADVKVIQKTKGVVAVARCAFSLKRFEGIG